MTLLRMLAFRPGGVAEEPRAATAVKPPDPARGRLPDSATASAAAGAKPAAIPAAPAPAAEGAGWAQILAQLELTGAARQLASHCVFLGRQGALVRLALDPRNQLVRTVATEEKLAQALSRHFGSTVRLEFQSGAAQGAETPAQAQRRASEAEVAAARRDFEEDAGVKSLRERFGATVLPDTIRPVK
jgi:DNA polymerase-3 subunit gamma/tau